MLEDGEFFLGVFVALEFLLAAGDLGLVDLVQGTEESVFATVFFLQFGEGGGGGFEVGDGGVDVRLLLGEVAGDDEGLWHEVAGPAFVLGLALLVSLQDAGGLGHPAVGGDEVAIVLHGGGPVICEVLIDGVGIDEQLAFRVMQEVFRKVADDFLGQAVELELP